MEKMIFIPGGLINWPDATQSELLEEAEATAQAVDSGCYENEEIAIEYYYQLLARLGA